MWHQWFNRYFTNLQECFLCVKKTKITTLFNDSSPPPPSYRCPYCLSVNIVILSYLASLAQIRLKYFIFQVGLDNVHPSKSKSKSALLSILPHVPYIHTENWNCSMSLLTERWDFSLEHFHLDLKTQSFHIFSLNKTILKIHESISHIIDKVGLHYLATWVKI